jgi:hypothetical protein
VETAFSWRRTSGQRICEIRSHGAGTVLAVSPDGGHVAAGGADGVVWWSPTGEPTVTELPAQSSAITGVAFSIDGSRVVTGTENGTVAVWYRVTGHRLFGLEEAGTDAIVGLAFDGAGARLLSASEHSGVRVLESVPVADRVNLLPEAGRPVTWGVLLRGLTGGATSIEEFVRQLEARAEVSPAERSLMQIMASTAGSRAGRLRDAAEATVHDPNAGASAYRTALQQVRTSVYLDPDHTANDLLLGMALLRCGRLRAASNALQSAAGASDPDMRRMALAFLSMAQCGTGLRDEAAAILTELRGSTPPDSDDPRAARLRARIQEAQEWLAAADN